MGAVGQERGAGLSGGLSGGRGAGPSGAQRALFTVVVAGVALSALLLRPGGWPGRNRGPIGADLPVIMLAVAWGVLCLVLFWRHRRQIGANAPLDPLERRLVEAVRGTLLVIVFGVPAAAIALHRLRQRPYRPPPLDRGEIVPAAHRHLNWRPAAPGSGHASLWYAVFAVTLVLFIGALGYAFVRLRAEWERKQRRPRPQRVGVEAEALAEAVESGRRALLEGSDARSAVISCYVAMEASLAASGVTGEASDTPQDLLERVAASGLGVAAAASVLTDLFREARYSSHPMSDVHRDRAAAALNGIAAGLGAGVA